MRDQPMIDLPGFDRATLAAVPRAAFRAPRGAFRTLWRSERDAYVAHLVRLEPEARRRRFHRAMTDEALAAHAERVFADPRALVIGWFRRGALRGAAEVALYEAAGRGVEAEAAFAIEARWRTHGVGRALMRRAMLAARNRGARTLHIATELGNRPMLRLALRSGARFTILETDVDGILTAGKRTIYSVGLETFAEEAGLLGYLRDRLARGLRHGAARLRRAAARRIGLRA